MYKESLKQLQPVLQKTKNFLQKELQSIRTGRANIVMLENIKVDYYGAPTVLTQMASITVQAPRTLVIEPWDKQTTKDIEKALQEVDLGGAPTVDNNVIRVTLPEPTEERRQELTKIVHEKAEQTRIVVRNEREEVWKKIQAAQKDGVITEDDLHIAQKELQAIIDGVNKDIEAIANKKEEEIMTV